jgi:glycosyltransferase involved in cell wall biosynthesis
VTSTNEMTDTLKVSVIVPVYNGANTVEACIQSLLALDYPEDHRELIFVDNASTDKTPEILSNYQPKIRVASEAKRGPAAARNCGVRAARHEIVVMTDADCTVDRDWLRRLVEAFDDPTVDLVGGTILSKRPCNSIELFGERIHDHRMAIEVWTPPYVITMNWAARKSAFILVECFDEDFLRCEDVDFAYRAFDGGVTFVFASEAIVYHENESTFRDLFYEGYLHGFYSVQAIKKHKRLLKRFGHRRFQAASYADLLKSLKDSVFCQSSDQARCDFTFNSGKKLGKLCGSVRFGHLDL